MLKVPSKGLIFEGTTLNLDIDSRLKSIQSTPSNTQITPPKQEIDAQTILNGYSVAEIEKSPIKYYKATQKVVDELLNVIQSQETAQKESIGELTRTILKLNSKNKCIESI